ncbi:MAG: leucine--tRNA ligase [bacterium]|nr:leucine--tRNA ligase [bacterium]
MNWCAGLGTVLANEEVIDGKSERGDHPVTRIPLRQWMLRITAYADRLEGDLETLDWSHSIKTMQREWIGRSTGAEVDFYIGDPMEYGKWRESRETSGFPKAAGDDVLRVYTTRPDTQFGATYMVIAPEHPFVDQLTNSEQREAVNAYCAAAAGKSDRQRQEDKRKTGVFTGSHAWNPATDQQIPIWISDYVLITYGTGAIMAVPAHDERDFEFAKEFDIEITPVVDPGDQDPEFQKAVLAGEACYAGKGTAVNSGKHNGVSTDEFKTQITDLAAGMGVGRAAVNYKLRDWLFSRQRFWGEPFPVLHEVDENNQPTGAIRAVDAADLPVDLPKLEDYKPHGRPEPPLAKADDDWLYVEVDGKRYKRETNTMPQWAGSCWYYLRFIDPKNNEAFVDAEKEKAWMPVDLYIGGAEHAVLHLLYARFWHKVLYDRGYVSTIEPFQKLINQGMILGDTEFTGYQDGDKTWVSTKQVKRDEERNPVHKKTGDPLTAVSVPEEDVEKKGDGFVLTGQTEIQLDARAHKMSKARGNVVNPDEIVRDFGADTLRLYEMFMGPLEATKPWNMQGVGGVRNFLDRVWRMVIDFQAEEIAFVEGVEDVEPTEEQHRMLHRTIQAVTDDTAGMGFNTAIARMMEFVNFFTKQDVRPKSALKTFVLLLSPYAPHLAEELWSLLGGEKSLAYEPWPTYDESFLKEDTVELPVQINGKVRAKISVAADAGKDVVEKLALADEKVIEMTAGKTIVKLIVVPGRLVNLVVK